MVLQRSQSLEMVETQDSIERRIEFFRREIFSKRFANLSEDIKNKLKKYYEELTDKRFELTDKQSKNDKKKMDQLDNYIELMKKPKGLGPWEILWEHKKKDICKDSPYSHFPSYVIRSIIVKGGDDLRQEIIAMQIIQIFRDIFVKEGAGLFVRPYEIIVTGQDNGVLEFCTDSISIDGMKKKYKGMNLSSIFKLIYGYGFEEAQKNFTESLAAYSIIAYILQIKDRHNGNQLIDSKGHYIHIDFGFILCTSPGSINFENAPFKLTHDYVELMGGEESPMFTYFRILLLQGFTALRKYIDEICNIIQIMMVDSDLPCFEKFDFKVFRDRFKERYTDKERSNYVDQLIKDSIYAKRTAWYDDFQRMTNKIEP